MKADIDELAKTYDAKFLAFLVDMLRPQWRKLGGHRWRVTRPDGLSKPFFIEKTENQVIVEDENGVVETFSGERAWEFGKGAVIRHLVTTEEWGWLNSGRQMPKDRG